MADLLTLFRAEAERLAEAIPAMEPGTEAHIRSIELLRVLRWEIHELETPLSEDVPPPPVLTPVPESAAAADAGADTAAPAPSFDVEAYKAGLRARMADARTNFNADTKAWLSEVGATKFSAITDPCKLMRLNELVTAFEKEHA